jgi:MFS family permease
LEAIGFAKSHIGPVMSIGQFSEIACLAVLGLFLKRIGYKWILALGCFAYAVRFAIFAQGTPDTRPMIAAAMVLHGMCYGFFFAGAYVFVERVARPDIRHSVQTVFGIIILGLGPVLAGLYNEWLDTFAGGGTTGGAIDWSRVWYAQAALGLVSGLVILAAFWPRLPDQPAADA